MLSFLEVFSKLLDNTFMNLLKILFNIMLITLLFTSCEDTTTGDVVNEAFETDRATSGNIINGQCYQDQYSVPTELITRKLDIAIVIDTSGSISDERASIAQGFDYFISQLPEEVDYRIAVILGHGDNTGRSGGLYQKGSEPRVLSSDLHTVEEIKTHLVTKMNNPHTDGETDGGELGLYSFLKATEGDQLVTNQAYDFFRPDAALTVVFVADEQDICAEYPVGVTPVVDPQGGEDRSLAKYCKDDDGNFIITPQMVVDRVKDIQDDSPYIIGGVLYKSNQTMPMNGENEIGYGYIDAINLSGGITVDMANGDYSDGLANIGRLATVSIQPANDFNLNSTKVDPSTIEALVDNISVAFTYNNELNQVNLTNPRDAFSVAKIKYCDKEEKPLTAKLLAVGGFHSCALLLEGEVKCWGRNNYGQLGLSHTNNIGDDEAPSSQEVINLGAKAIDLSSGLYHTCAILEDGSVKCWGQNLKGQLGLGHMNNIGDDEHPSSISSIPLASKAKKLYAGTNHTCALLDNKKVQCWGDNSFGQLGLGHTNNIGDDETLDSLGYVSLGGDVVQMDISTISFHSCAVLVNGDLKCWGRNNSGQLGLGHTNSIGDDELPSDVGSVPFGSQILQLATGNQHTCALASGQNIRCWGSNLRGQIGTGNLDTIGDDEAANSIGFINTGASGHTLVSTGNFHTCAIGTDEKVYCFGQGANGVTGLGHTNNIGDDEAVLDNSDVDLGELPISQVASGIFHTCALTKDTGEVICWGMATYGQLGYGNTNIIGDDETPGANLISLVAAE